MSQQLADFIRGLLTYVEDGNVVEVRECGFVEELQSTLAECEAQAQDADTRDKTISELVKYGEMLMYYYDAFRDNTPKGPTEIDDIALAKDCLDKAKADVEVSLVAENAKLQAWVNDLQSGMYINCVYCGHRYGPQDEVPATMAEALKEHVENCVKHPMYALKQRAEKDAADADRWRTLIGMARLRVIGTAGPFPHEHMGIELWRNYPPPVDSRRARTKLYAFVDAERKGRRAESITQTEEGDGECS